jgi:hypothetical protein
LCGTTELGQRQWAAAGCHRLPFSSPERNRAIDSKPPDPVCVDGKPDLARRSLVQGTPNLEWFGTWDDSSVALLGCIIFDVFSGREVSSRTRPG